MAVNDNANEKGSIENTSDDENKESKLSNGTEVADKSLVEEKQGGKKKRKKKRHSKGLNDSVNAAVDSFVGNVINQAEKSGENAEKGESGMEIVSPRSKEKTKKRKSSELGKYIEDNTSKEIDFEMEGFKRNHGDKSSNTEDRDVSLMNGSEDISGSAKKKKQKKRKSGELPEKVNGATEDNLKESLNEETESKAVDSSTMNEEIAGSFRDDTGSDNAASPKKKKHHHRDSHGGQIKANKVDKFSPRYTRSMKIIP